MPSSPTSEPEQLLGLQDLVWLHAVAIEEFGGMPGIRDKGALESTIKRPASSFEGRALYKTPFERAAALAESVVQNHGFLDANLRTGMYAMAAWLDREGFRVDANRGDVRDLALAIATHQIDLPGIAIWLEKRAVPA